METDEFEDTTFVNVNEPADERIVIIEGPAEPQLRQDHVLRLETRTPNIEGRGQITVRDLRISLLIFDDLSVGLSTAPFTA